MGLSRENLKNKKRREQRVEPLEHQLERTRSNQLRGYMFCEKSRYICFAKGLESFC